MKKLKIEKNELMISYNVQSLYPNVSVEEAIRLAVNFIWERNKQLKITKNELFMLFNLAVINKHFRFFNEFYRHEDGIVMGSPLAPISANLIMNHLEKEKISRIINTKAKLWNRYMGDIVKLISISN